ncbi:MAG: TIM barrel protein [Candidatus Nanoarchaeia archaeon]|nr:TIM barrel protein [Candidatus Nanoarchaeia archaeon]
MSSFNSEYKDGMTPKYRAGVLGVPLSIRSSIQIQDMAMRLNEGIKNIESSAVSPDIAEGIPKEHFQEMRRLSILTDSHVSMHAPIIDASGFTQQGWSEQNRKAAENQFSSVINNAYALNDEGNVPVVFHGANMMGVEWDKSVEEKYREDIKKEYEERGKPVPERMPRVTTIVNQMTGQVQAMEIKEKYTMGEEKAKLFTPEKQLESINRNQWDQEKLQILSEMKQAMELNDRKEMLEREMMPLIMGQQQDILHENEKQKLSELSHKAHSINNHINEINKNVLSHVDNAYDTFVRYVDKDKLKPEQQKELEAHQDILKKEIGKNIDNIDQNFYNQQKAIIGNKRELDIEDRHKLEKLNAEHLNQRAQLFTSALSLMQETPDVFVPVNEFSKQKASDTFSNIAMEAYRKFKDKAPIIAIENSYPNMPLSVAKDLKEAIELSRSKFADKLVSEQNLDPKEARNVAQKLIGATWDVGHINLLRKSGYSEADIIKEAESIAPFVKHIHLTDNFGTTDSHLPPGMGNVPIKQILDTIEEKGNLDNVRQIVEAGNFVQNFKESPYPYTLEALGSPIYSMGGAPYWNEVQQRSAGMDYSMGFGEMLPDYHFKQFYGGGWSAVPRELGGEMAGTSQKGRFAEGS